MSDRPTSRNRIVIVGGGLSGLVAAHRIHTQTAKSADPVDLVLLEAKDRVGGAIWTEHVDGFLLEGGADSFITNKPAALNLCKELGLGDQLIGPDATNRRSFVVRNGKLLPVPEGFVLMAPRKLGPIITTPILSFRGKLRMLMDLIRPRRNDDADESLASFVKRRLGREALERLVQPLVGGIYTADPNELSVKATLPQFVEMERKYGGLIRGAFAEMKKTKNADRTASGARYGLFASLIDGMETLPRALAASLPPGTIRTNSPVRRVSRSDTGGWLVEPLDGPPIEATGVILATEAHASARMVDALDPELALHLRSIPYASSAIVIATYKRDQVSHPLDGFGVVVPTIENRRILAISFTSVKFPGRAPKDSVILRIFVGGATQPELFDLDNGAIEALACSEASQLLGITGPPIFTRVSRHPRAMPQYTLGHLDRVATIRTRAALHPNLVLAGNAFDGVGIPDIVKSAQTVADDLLASLVVPAVV